MTHNNKKKIAIMLSMAILMPTMSIVSTIPNDSTIVVNAEEEYTAETSFVFEFDSETMTATLKSFKGTETVVNIPPTVGGGIFTVTAIDGSAFKGNTNITSVSMPDTITQLSKTYSFMTNEVIIGNIFENCTSLITVNLPNNITFIPSATFRNCTSLTTVNIPDGVTYIHDRTFEGCSSLKNINLPNTLKTIGYNAFYSSGLESIIIPNSVTTIYGGDNILHDVYDSGAFAKCKDLRKVTLSNNLKTIEENSFYQCTSLEEITIPDSVTKIEVSAFADCSSLSKVNMSNNIETIEGNLDSNFNRGAFQGCNLKEITLPSSIRSIGKKALGYDLTTDGSSIPSYGNSNPIEDFTINYYTTESKESEAIILTYASQNGFKTVNLGVEPTADIPDDIILGDIDGDGNVRVNDIQLVRQWILHLVDTPDNTSKEYVCADANKDGSVKVNDIQLIRQYILHLIDTL